MLRFFVVRCPPNGSAPPTLLPNGSFEEGQTTPTSWRIRAGCEWASGEAHHGKRYLSGRSAKDRVVAESESLALQPKTDYRLHGWLRCPNGEGRLGVDLLNQQGQIVRQQQSPRVRGGSEWRYLALECKPEMSETAARVWFRVKGRAGLDDVGLAFAATSFMGNKALEGDDRKRTSPRGAEPVAAAHGMTNS